MVSRLPSCPSVVCSTLFTTEPAEWLSAITGCYQSAASKPAVASLSTQKNLPLSSSGLLDPSWPFILSPVILPWLCTTMTSLLTLTQQGLSPSRAWILIFFFSPPPGRLFLGNWFASSLHLGFWSSFCHLFSLLYFTQNFCHSLFWHDVTFVYVLFLSHNVPFMKARTLLCSLL
jgi:hypothetical protein